MKALQFNFLNQDAAMRNAQVDQPQWLLNDDPLITRGQYKARANSKRISWMAENASGGASHYCMIKCPSDLQASFSPTLAVD